MNNMKNKKEIFKLIHNSLKLDPKVISFADETNKFKVDIYIGENRPDIGFSTYSTIGLSNYTIGLVDEHEHEIRVEFIGMCVNDFVEFPNIIASCAFNIIKDSYSCRPGMVVPNIIRDYDDKLEMKHIYYTYPTYWENLQGQVIDDHIVNWLFTVPISDNELEYLEKYGIESFEELLETNNTEVFDIYTKSVL